MSKRIKDFLTNQFENWTNDLNEEIVSVIIADNKIYVDTEIVVNLEVSNSRDLVEMRGNILSQRMWVKSKLEENGFIDEITENYATGFYCNYFEGLTIYDFINSSDIVCEENSNVAVYIDMHYVMERAKIEALLEDYKNCA